MAQTKQSIATGRGGLPVILWMAAIFFTSSALAQSPSPAFMWWNPGEAAFPVLEGKAWPNNTKDFYDRLPARAENKVRKAVWNLSQESAGLMLRFRANTDQIKVRYVTEGRHALPHMAKTGVSGLAAPHRSHQTAPTHRQADHGGRVQEKRVRELNLRLADLTNEMGVKYLEAGKVLLESDGMIDETLFTDGLHPNAEGYRRLSRAYGGK